MRRREFIGIVAGAAAWPGAAAAQQSGKTYRIAMMTVSSPLSALTEHGGIRHYQVFFEELRRLGFVEGRNLIVERYSALGRPEMFGSIADQILASQPEVLFSTSQVVTGRVSRTGTIPVVGIVNDPLAMGFTSSLARPSHNVTGAVLDAGIGVISKRLELLRQVRPTMSKVAFLQPLYMFAEGGFSDGVRQVFEREGIRLIQLGPDNPIQDATYRRAFAEIDRDRPDAIMVSDAQPNFTFRNLIVELVNATDIPAMYPLRESIEAGGLMSYAADYGPLFRQAAVQISLILQGRSVAEVPFYQNHKYEFLINRRTAEAQGITIPPHLLVRADEVIE